MGGNKPDKVINDYILAFTLTADKADALAVITKNIDCTDYTEMTIYPIWTPGSIGDTLSSKVELSNDDSNWHAEPDETVAAGVGTVIAKTREFVSLTTSAETVPVISIPVSDRRARIGFSETAAGTAGVLTVHVRLSRLK